MIQKATHLFILIHLLYSCAHETYSHQELSSRSEPGEWESLFGGKVANLSTLNGNRPDPQNWRIEGGLLKAIPGRKADLRSLKMFKNFEMIFEFAIEAGSNSGVKYLINPVLKNVGPEYQIIDEALHPDGSMGPKRHTSAVYDLFPSTASNRRPLGEFNMGKIVVKGLDVEHWLNDELSIRYNIASNEFKAARLKSKFSGVLDFATHSPSYVLIQHHGEEVAFRSIKIRRLP